ncbi:MAG: acetyl-CoA carboxylase carboxyl transferase subunit beta [Dehalococcoidia bacterium]|nr:MAG: acetyl-CoA carboxylase carboxyl transferase subunit beta [Dehalococcoidia bacterium]
MADSPIPMPSISAREWADLLFDQGSFSEQFAGIATPDPLHFEDSRPYAERVKEAREQSGGKEAVLTGTAHIGGMPVVVAVSDFRFIGGSMGYAVGERVAHAMERAREAKTPFLAVTCSGGARMQEGMVALLQMAKTAAAAQRLHEAGVPMITLLANPTTGGVFASYGTQGDVILAEAGALIGFAGPRVRAVHDAGEERETLYAEDLYDRGLVDLVAPREGLRNALISVLDLVRPTAAPDLELLPPVVEARDLERGWTTVERARHAERPRALHYIEALTSDFVPLRGDRSGTDDPALVGGLGRIGDTNVVLIGQERGDMSLDGARHDGRVSPAGYRKAKRLMLLAERLHLPLVTFVDTPGAHDGIADEGAGLAGTISDCLATMASLTTPSVAVVIGEGGSGGALALTWADRLLMQQNAMYAITSPEGAAAILYRDRARAPEVAEALGVAATDLHALGVVDALIAEPAGGAHLDPAAAVRLMRPAVRRALAEAMRGKGGQRRQRREARLNSIGVPPGGALHALRNLGDVIGEALPSLEEARGVAAGQAARAAKVASAAGAVVERLRHRGERPAEVVVVDGDAPDD